MDNQLTFRYATIADIDQLLFIEKTCFATPWDRASFEHEITINKHGHYLIAEYNNEVVGYAGAWWVYDEGHITNVAILPTFRGRKFCKLLREAVLILAKQNEVSYLTLEVRASNLVAQNLYQSLEFQALAIRKRYYTDNQEDAVIMRVDFDNNQTEEA